MAREISIPFTPLPAHGYIADRLDFKLDGAQAHTLRDLRDSLIAEGATLAGGKQVRHASDAVRYLLERLAAAEDA